MEDLSSCYFCGTAIEAPVREYPVVPEDLGGGDGPTVSLCPTCRRKHRAVVEAVVAATDGRAVEDAEGLADPDGTTAGTPEDTPDPDGQADGPAEPDEPSGDPAPASGQAASDEAAADEAVSDEAASGQAAASPEAAEGEPTASPDADDSGGLSDDEDSIPGLGDSAAGDADDAVEPLSVDPGGDDDPGDVGDGDPEEGVAEDHESGSAAGDDAPEPVFSSSTPAGAEEPEENGEEPEPMFSDSTPVGGGAEGADPEESVGEAALEDAEDGDDDGEPSVDLSTPPHSKVVRQLQNRDFPVERGEIVAVAAGAYGLSEAEARAALDGLVEAGVLEEEGGRLFRAGDRERGPG